MADGFDLFDFVSDDLPTPGEMRQLILGFLAGEKSSGAALSVPLKRRQLPVSAAAFWLGGRNNKITKCVIVELCLSRDNLYGVGGDHGELTGKITTLTSEKEKLQKIIELTEPELAENDGLFADFKRWHYQESCNADYHKVCRKLAKLENTLHFGSKFERIKGENLADYLYIAAPEGLVSPDEVPPGWGLLTLSKYAFRKSKNPEKQTVEANSRIHLAQNIAAKSFESVLFANGVRANKGKIGYSKAPRRRRVIR